MLHISVKWHLTMILSVVSCQVDIAKINNLQNLILDKIDEAISYDYPKDNSEYFKNLDKNRTIDYGTYDFIIIGSGSTGSVLANRLSFNNSWKVLLLEAGDMDSPFTDIPSMYQYSLRSKYNWGYNTTSQKYGCKAMIDKRCLFATGKVLGGCSSINGLIYTRGNAKDYDNWEKLGNKGWSFEKVEPFFKRMENAQFPSEVLGHTGPLYVNYSSPVNKLQTLFAEALTEMGSAVTDYNGQNQIGTSRMQTNIYNGKRISGANSYVKPVLHRRNLNVTLNAFVMKLLVNTDSNKVYGVRFIKNGEVFQAYANKEIILSAGAINSAQVLMLSGIGPEEVLKKFQIPLVQALPVGKKLIDHLAFNLHFKSNLSQDTVALEKQIEDFLGGEGLLTTPFNGKSLSFMHPDREGRPTVEYVLLPPTGGDNYVNRPIASPYIKSIQEGYMSKIDPKKFFSIIVILLHPKSRGTVSIQSKSPIDFPVIDSNLFGEEEDIDKLYEAIRFISKITETDAFKKINASLFSNVTPCLKHDLHSREYWYCTISYMAIPSYHSMGTTNMGVDPKTSVVDPQLKVHGLSGLRVADCGVIPDSLSGHTNGPAFMIGEKLSSMIEDEYKEKHV
ncbi:glucose dehydrogenase [FAD, quinone]-like isoform X4 [Coccinella septempunctata]|uniref:glucose dehydrogenase [FAD, quinone]-like isoform X4 n=1 Tax=Coccinella septempunctata TaxID=41139 RepID=UPI001D075C5A|nr:glucose dehydrogenase [FAD, quinone]-like isoform X4 [Coccinella septempunctata]